MPNKGMRFEYCMSSIEGDMAEITEDILRKKFGSRYQMFLKGVNLRLNCESISVGFDVSRG